MGQRIWDYLFGSVFRRGATLLTGLTLASYILGLVRDMVFSRVLGAGRILDVYNAAFIVPDVLLNIFIAGALGAAFVPVFSHLLARDEKAEAERLASTMLTAAPVAMAFIGVVAFFLMPRLAVWVAPGFSPDEMTLLVHMSRLMLISPVLFALSNTLGSMLVSLERFFGYGIAPVLYNVGIIVGAVAVPVYGPLSLVIGTIAGAGLHLACRAIAVWRSGFALSGTADIRDANFRQVVMLMLPRMAGQPIEQLTFFLFTNLASTLAVGSIAVLNFARNFHSVPVALFGISFSVAMFPILSKKAALNDREGFVTSIRQAAVPLVLVSVASAVFYIVAGRFVIGILLGGGKFDSDAVAATASLLAFFSLSIPAESFIHLLVRAFYALKDTWTPIFITAPGLGAIYILAMELMPRMGLSALPTTYAVVVTAEALLLAYLLRRKLARLGT